MILCQIKEIIPQNFCEKKFILRIFLYLLITPLHYANFPLNGHNLAETTSG